MQIFHRSTNALARFSIFGALFIIAFILWVIMMINRSPLVTRQGVVQAQPVPFSHEHHVRGLGIDCRYCHTSVESSAFAGIPPTSTCMNCHSQIWTNADMLEPVRASFRSGKPIVWTRIHNLPDFVRFDHSVHIHKGIGCASCHGEVDRMQLMYQAMPLTMEWCLSCHRAPEAHVRPRSKVFDMEWRSENRAEEGPRLVKEYNIRKKTDCSICHY
ncbi:MAG TPA: cytochrome c3 family protein [Thermoanaerobaculia bacterium]|nr:cytochrome c3 family protein [Thermoanaerobaculia bacterium]